jgi:hypothetical protein
VKNPEMRGKKGDCRFFALTSPLTVSTEIRRDRKKMLKMFQKKIYAFFFVCVPESEFSECFFAKIFLKSKVLLFDDGCDSAASMLSSFGALFLSKSRKNLFFGALLVDKFFSSVEVVCSTNSNVSSTLLSVLDASALSWLSSNVLSLSSSIAN